MALMDSERFCNSFLGARGAADFVALFDTDPYVPVAFTKRMASLRNRIQNIVPASAEKKMLRVGTASVVAAMAYTLIARAYAVMQRIAKAMCKDFLFGAGKNDYAIALRGCAVPVPAAARFHDTPPELFFGGGLRAGFVVLQNSTPTRLVVVVSAQSPCKNGFSA